MSYVNEAVWDRIARVALDVVLLYLGWSGTVDGNWGKFLKVFGFLPLATQRLVPAVYAFRIQHKW